MQDLLISLFANFLWALIGAALVLISSLLFYFLPLKRLWRLKTPERLIICASTTHVEDTGEYKRPSTGIGELRALAIIESSISAVHKKIRFENIVMADETLGERIKRDIILLGGPKNNRFTKLFLDNIKNLSVVTQDDFTLTWKASNPEHRMKAPSDANGKVSQDYGLIVRMRNPFSSQGSMLYLFSGQHTFGVIAAAAFFVDNYSRFSKITKSLKPNLTAIVKCDVVDNYPVNISLVHEKTWWRKPYGGNK